MSTKSTPPDSNASAPNPPLKTRTYTTPSGRAYTVMGGFADAHDLYDFDSLCAKMQPETDPSPPTK